MSKEISKDFLVIIDIQPEFQHACQEVLYEVIDKVNESDRPIICVFVGRQLGNDRKQDVMAYYMENGMDPAKVESMTFVDKDFGFFRTWMDLGVPSHITIKAIQELRQSQLNDSRQLNDSQWNNILTPEDKQSFYFYDEPIYYPQFKKEVFENPEHTSFELIGGARHECLAEMALYLESIGKEFTINEELCYGQDKKVKKNKMKK